MRKLTTTYGALAAAITLACGAVNAQEQEELTEAERAEIEQQTDQIRARTEQLERQTEELNRQTDALEEQTAELEEQRAEAARDLESGVDTEGRDRAERTADRAEARAESAEDLADAREERREDAAEAREERDEELAEAREERQEAVADERELSQRRDELTQMAEQTIEELRAQNEGAASLYEQAHGYAVFDTTKGGLIVTGAGGTGVAMEKDGNDPVFMHLGQAGIGLGAGLENYKLVLLLEDEQTYQDFVSGQWDGSISAQASAGEEGVAAEEQFVDGVKAYRLTDAGLMAQVDVSGIRFWVSEELNDDVQVAEADDAGRSFDRAADDAEDALDETVDEAEDAADEVEDALR